MEASTLPMSRVAVLASGFVDEPVLQLRRRPSHDGGAVFRPLAERMSILCRRNYKYVNFVDDGRDLRMPNAIDQGRLGTGWMAALTNAARAAGPPLLFGLRLWAAVCLALYVAFWLELDNAFWAGTSAAFVCDPHLGASLRKGWFRLIGTVVGAVAIVVLTAWFPQNRAGFLLSLALWCAACALVATLLRNFAAYAAGLAGYTAAIIASDQLGATGGPNGLAFTLAITRVSEIWIGIVCAGIVLAGTDFGAAPRRLATQFAALSAEIASRFKTTLMGGSEFSDMQRVRRQLAQQVSALDPVIDEAIGESSTLRYHSPVLQAAVDGLFATLAGWRTVAVRLSHLADDTARQEADAVLGSLPQELLGAPYAGEPRAWVADPTGMRRRCRAAVRMLIAMPATTPSLRLLADQTATVLAGLSRALDGLALLVGDPASSPARHRLFRLNVPDWLPAFVTAGRVFVIIGAVEVFWIVTAWPNGASAITFAAIVAILLAPRVDEAYTAAVSFTIGIGLATVGAAIILFAALPKVETFAGFSIVIGLYLVPVGALMAQPWQAAIFTAMALLFLPLLAPANQMSYNTLQFYNAALAIVAGSVAAAASFRLMPPLSPTYRAARLWALTLRDLRRLATDAVPPPQDRWEGRNYGRLAALPDGAEPVQRAQLVAALSVGTAIIHLRRIVPQLGLGLELDSALAALAQANRGAAIASLTALDHRLASLAEGDPQNFLVLRARGRILGICDALAQYGDYFDTGVPR
jgi:uncharacterized membrane protein YccC